MKKPAVKYVSIMKRLLVVFNVIAVPAFMVLLVFAFSFSPYYAFGAAAVAVSILVVYGFYAMRVSMGVVLEAEVTPEVIHLKTKRKTFTYDAQRGCVAVKTYKNRYVGTFRTQDSEDKFTFYRYAPFTGYREEVFTEAEMREIFPPLGDSDVSD